MIDISISVEKEKNYFDEDLEYGLFNIKKLLIPFKDSDRLSILELIAYDINHKKIAEKRELIILQK